MAESMISRIVLLYKKAKSSVWGRTFKSDSERNYYVAEYLVKNNVVEVRHGEWKFVQIDDCIICSECKNSWDVIDNCTETFDYCPKCGAKMDGKEVANNG